QLAQDSWYNSSAASSVTSPPSSSDSVSSDSSVSGSSDSAGSVDSCASSSSPPHAPSTNIIPKSTAINHFFIWQIPQSLCNFTFNIYSTLCYLKLHEF